MEVPVVEVLMAAGLQVPLTPLGEVGGKEGGVVFWQNGPRGLKSGVVAGLMTKLSVVDWAHCPGAGVKVVEKLPGVAVLITGGFQVPLMPLSEVPGKGCGVEFWHTTPISEKVGVGEGLMVICSVTGVAH